MREKRKVLVFQAQSKPLSNVYYNAKGSALSNLYSWKSHFEAKKHIENPANYNISKITIIEER